MSIATPTLFISGASGNFGKTFLPRAEQQGLFDKYHVRAGTSTPNKLNELKTNYPKVEWVVCDLEKDQQICDSLKDVDTLFLIPGGVENREELAVKAINCAKKQGVKRVILYSLAGCDSADVLFARQFRKMEIALESSGMRWNHLRTIWFQENVFGWVSLIKQEGRFPFASGSGKLPWMNLADPADAALVLLSKEDKTHDNRQYTITGPELLSAADVAAIMSEKLKRQIKWEDVSREEQLKILANIGFPDWQARGCLELMDLFKNNSCAFVSHDFKLLTGKEGTRFADWFETVKDAFQ